MKISRRAFIPALGAVCVSAALPLSVAVNENEITVPFPRIKPKALKRGDVIAIAAPAGPLRDTSHADIFKHKLESLGFRVKMGRNVKLKHGFFTASDEERAKELMEFIEDKEVHGIVFMKGGWGSARILDLLNYTSIRNHPKILMGFSDITSLVNAITLKTGLVTFHGPSGNSTWNDFSTNYIWKLLVTADKVKYFPGPETEDVITTIVPGIAEGELFGGNLSVLSAMSGTNYFPDFRDKILFLEEVKEEPFRIDRMIVQLKQNGVFDKVKGIIIGKFRDCIAEEPEFSFTCEEIFLQHFSSLEIPVYSGAMIGHITNKYALPLGLPVRMNADKGTIELLEAAVLS